MFVNDQVSLMLSKKSWFRTQADKYKVARWVTDGEGAILHLLVASHEPNAVIEVGTANGWSACWMAAAGRSVYTFDVADRPKVFQEKDLESFEKLIRFQPRELEASHLESFDSLPRKLFFLDGDHTYKGIKKDWETIRPFIKDNDIVVFHDVKGEAGVLIFWGQLQEEYKKDFSFVECETERGMGILRPRR